jgi:ferrous iron transport protein A
MTNLLTEEYMMPLTFANVGEKNSIKKIGGKEDSRQFLENLGFVPGTPVTVITQIAGNVIVNIKESRVAISREMASKIMI